MSRRSSRKNFHRLRLKLVCEKERLIEITVDGELSEDELPDFLKIKKELKKMSLAIDSLNLWLDQTIASGKIDKNLFPSIKK